MVKIDKTLAQREGDEIIHLDENVNPTDDMSLDSKKFNEIVICTDLTDMLQNNIKNRSRQQHMMIYGIGVMIIIIASILSPGHKSMCCLLSTMIARQDRLHIRRFSLNYNRY